MPRFGALRSISDSAAAIEQQYSKPLQWMHWVYAAGFGTCMGTVLASQQTTGPTFLGSKGETKGYLMMSTCPPATCNWRDTHASLASLSMTVHKSSAVILSALVLPRVMLRAVSAVPKALPVSFPEHFIANLSHVSM